MMPTTENYPGIRWEREHFKWLEQEVEKLLSDTDVKDIIKMVTYNMFTDTRIDTIRILYKLREKVKQEDDQYKIQKVINYFCYEVVQSSFLGFQGDSSDSL